MSATKTTTTATPTNIASARKSRATRAAEKNEAAAKTTETSTPAAAPTPAPKPEAKIDLGLVQNPTWKPSATLPDGRTVACGHTRYGHESERAAKSCIARVVREAMS